MSSTREIQPQSCIIDEAGVGLLPEPDPNANVSNDISKGAIPKKIKTPPQKRPAAGPKPLKLNNNIENMPTMNGDEAPKINGFDSFEPSCSSFKLEDTSSDDNDLLSVSDDGCIYTYKGDNVADLPSSFFTLEIPPPEIPEPVPNRTETSSPEMDYLEMDFDPGNNGDNESDSSEDDKGKLPLIKPENLPKPISVAVKIEEKEEPKPSTSKENIERINESSSPVVEKQPKVMAVGPTQEEIERMPWACTLEQRTKTVDFRYSKRCHCTRGELVSPNGNMPVIRSASAVATCRRSEKVIFEPVMIWSSFDANVKQITQIGPSACGATAVLNVLNALRFPIPTLDKIKECVRTRLRRNDSPLTDYLMSRSEAGTTHEDLIEGLRVISNGTIYARFFHMYPERVMNLYTWLAFWLKNGAVPIATLNIQKCTGVTPDAWHHQMIYGVDDNGVHLTNPFECVESGLLWPQLCSESVLLVRRDDVLSRWNVRTDLPELMKIKDIKWRRINVVGQVANMVHESNREQRPGFTNTSHIRIPAAYSSGITLATAVNSPAWSLLQQTPELPLF